MLRTGLLNFLLHCDGRARVSRLLLGNYFGAAMFTRFKERNDRIFQDKSSPIEAIAVQMVNMVQGRISSLPKFPAKALRCPSSSSFGLMELF